MELRQEWIPLPDGVRLSVNLFLPDEVAAGARVPVLLEYLPYRKDDSMAAADWDLINPSNPPAHQNPAGNQARPQKDFVIVEGQPIKLFPANWC